ISLRNTRPHIRRVQDVRISGYTSMRDDLVIKRQLRLWNAARHDEDARRVRSVIERYADLDVVRRCPVLATVERVRERTLATLGHRHFAAIRPKHVRSLELLPALRA